MFLYDQYFKSSPTFLIWIPVFKSNLTLCYTDCNVMLKVTRCKKCSGGLCRSEFSSVSPWLKVLCAQHRPGVMLCINHTPLASRSWVIKMCWEFRIFVSEGPKILWPIHCHISRWWDFFYLCETTFKLSRGGRKNFSVGRSLDDDDDDDENSLLCCAQDIGVVLNGCNKVLIIIMRE